MKSYTIPALTLLLMVLAGCGTSRMTEQQRFERSILKDFPFSVDSVSWLFTPLSFGEGLGVRSGDFPTFRFANAEYTDARPDAEIRPNGDYWVCNTFDAEQPKPQSEENIWRNVLVSRSNQRVVCIDRYLRGGRTVGYCYVFQSERKEYPTYGTLHWDVSDARNIEMVGEMLNDLKGLALKRHQMNHAQRALMTDSLNLVLVDEILSQHGFPRKEQVGDFANQAVWLVFQHADLDYQKRFLPQLEAAVSRGDIAPVFLALLRDRIDVREGRPQRYGTQIDGKGNIAPLLDASRVNQWRQEVGLPPIEQYENRNK